MARQSLLVVDADQRSLSVLEVSLRNAGYNVAGCASMARALEILEANRPDLIISDTELDDADGFTFVQRIRQNSAWSNIPFMFLSSDGSIESKIRGLELGVQDYLTKPIYIREVVARVGIELSRNERDDLASRGGSSSKTRFSGSLAEMSVVDLLQTIDVSRKTGVLYLVSRAGERGAMFFDAGSVIHAHVGELKGEDAVYRLLLWSEGSFDLEFRRVREGQQTVQLSTQALLMEGMHRLDQWGRLHEQLPSADVVLEVDGDVLRERLQDLPDENNDLLRLVDGQCTIEQILQARGGDRLETLRALVDLYFEGIVRERGTPLRSIAVVADMQGLDPATWAGSGHDTIPGPGGVLPSDPYAGLGLAAPPAYSRNHKPTTVGFKLASIQGQPELGLQSLESPLPASVPSPLSLGAKTADAIPAAAASRNSEAPAPGPQAVREVDHTPLTVGAHQVDDVPWAAAAEEGEPILRSSRPPQAFDRQRLMLDSTRPEAAGDQDADEQKAGDESDWAETEGLEEQSVSPEEAEASGAEDEGVATAENADAGLDDEGVDEQAVEAGRVEHEQTDDQGIDDEDRETAEFEPWDQTLDTLKEDPEVSQALDQIDFGPAPAPFVRSSPPAERDASPAGARRATELADSRADEIPPPLGQSVAEWEPSRRPLLLAALLLLGGAILISQLLRATESGSGPELELEQIEPGRTELAFEPERVLVQTEDSKRTAKPAAHADEALADEAPAEEALADEALADEALAEETRVEETRVEEAGSEEPGRAPEEDIGARYETQLVLAREHKRGTLAVTAYERAIELNPEGVEALSELAFLMLQRGRNAEAAELARKATQLDSSSSLAWITLGSARQHLNDEDGARRAYRNCVKHGRGSYVAECRAVLR